jgi:hypothetical protein
LGALGAAAGAGARRTSIRPIVTVISIGDGPASPGITLERVGSDHRSGMGEVNTPACSLFAWSAVAGCALWWGEACRWWCSATWPVPGVAGGGRLDRSGRGALEEVRPPIGRGRGGVVVCSSPGSGGSWWTGGGVVTRTAEVSVISVPASLVPAFAGMVRLVTSTVSRAE